MPNLGVVKEDEILSDLLEKVGKKLEELRKKKGYTSHETFAYDNEIPRVQYWRIEKGRANLTLKSLVKILAIHKLTVEEFFLGLYQNELKTKK
jgi:transcriptional regulator with XRE-family HTH domain